MNIVSIVMLGALPAAAWSTTFKRSSSKAILVFWLLLLAVGHTFYTLIAVDQNLHFQICHKDHTQHSLQADYQAPYLDQSWHEAFSTLVLAGRNTSQVPDNELIPDFIYSCFATTDYVGREIRDIMVTEYVRDGPFKALADIQPGIIIFWWAYTLLALVTLFVTEKKKYFPRWIHKQLFSTAYRRTSSVLVCNWKMDTSSTITETTEVAASGVLREGHSATIRFTVLKVVQITSQVIGLFAFFYCIIIQETMDVQYRNALSQESFAAVGQWGNLAVVLLVLAAAMISRLWMGRDARDKIALSGDKVGIIGSNDPERGDKHDSDVENGD